MLKKLYKHEFYSLFRILLPLYAALLGFALISKLTYLIDIKNTVFSIISGLSTTLYVILIIAMFIVGTVVIVMRFYKNLLSHEGYLTFTLPFTATQHITCKLICGVVLEIANFIVMICSLLILGAGTEFIDMVFKVIGEAFHMATDVYSAGTLIIIFAEFILLFLVSMLQGLLMFYASMSIGQQFRNKVGGAVVAYICLYAAVQIITTILISIIGFSNIENFENINNLNADAIGVFEIFIGCMIVYIALIATAYFFILRHFLTKKLNLE